jgi:hypothetical protein
MEINSNLFIGNGVQIDYPLKKVNVIGEIGHLTRFLNGKAYRVDGLVYSQKHINQINLKFGLAKNIVNSNIINVAVGLQAVAGKFNKSTEHDIGFLSYQVLPQLKEGHFIGAEPTLRVIKEFDRIGFTISSGAMLFKSKQLETTYYANRIEENWNTTTGIKINAVRISLNILINQK